MSLLTQEELLIKLAQAVHPNLPGVGKTTASGLKGFLTTLISEMLARSAAGAGSTGGSTGGSGAGGTGAAATGVLTAPGGQTYRLTVADDGSLHAELADGLPLTDPLGVLTSPSGLSYRLTVADDGTPRAVPAAGDQDPDALAFSTAAGLVNVAQQEAVNQLVQTLKRANVWPRLKALYPMVGGTARAHALNLKDPRDDDAAFRLTFFNNPRHSVLGVAWDGATQYADTHLVAPDHLALNSGHLGYYATSTTPPAPSHVEMGVVGNGQSFSLVCNFDGGIFQGEMPSGGTRARVATTLGFSLTSRQDAYTVASYRDGQLVANSTSFNGNAGYPSSPVLLAHRNDGYFSDRTCALASIGDGLTPAEALALSAAVAEFQRALGRDVALDADARDFALAAGLTDATQVNAVNALVKALKASGVWERLRAAYPMVGGTAQAHALNLKDPRDADTAFRLTFANDPRHTARGVEWNPQASTYATTHLVPADHISPTDHHLAYYAVTDGEDVQIEIGSRVGDASLSMLVRYRDAQNRSQFESNGAYRDSAPLAHGLGFTLDVRESSDVLALYRDGQPLPIAVVNNGNTGPVTAPLLLGGRQDGAFSSKVCGFASAGLGLTPAQAQAYSAAVRAFQQALGRDVTLAPDLLLA